MKALEEELEKTKEWNSTTKNNLEDAKGKMKDELKRLQAELEATKKEKQQIEQFNDEANE